jgi:hypothetical protein
MNGATQSRMTTMSTKYDAAVWAGFRDELEKVSFVGALGGKIVGLGLRGAGALGQRGAATGLYGQAIRGMQGFMGGNATRAAARSALHNTIGAGALGAGALGAGYMAGSAGQRR